MAFSQFSQFMGGGPQHQREDDTPQQGGPQLGLDSITLGQLKAMVGSAPKPKVRSNARMHEELRLVADVLAILLRLLL